MRMHLKTKECVGVCDIKWKRSGKASGRMLECMRCMSDERDSTENDSEMLFQDGRGKYRREFDRHFLHFSRFHSFPVLILQYPHASMIMWLIGPPTPPHSSLGWVWRGTYFTTKDRGEVVCGVLRNVQSSCRKTPN